jgi:hypothetical protein
VRAVADWSIDDSGLHRKVVLPPDEIVRLADRFCGDERVVVIDPACRGSTIRRRDGVLIDDGQHELRYITLELLQVQSAALSGWARGRRSGAGVVKPEILERVLAESPQLNDEQIAPITAGAPAVIGCRPP